MAYRDQPLGELALSIPRASALFRKYDMDYCCGGKQTLARAAARKELDVDAIGVPRRWSKLSTTSSCVITTDTASNCRN